MNTLYLECLSGISGDMTVASLLDLGADKDKLLEIINSMKLGCEIKIDRVEKCSINACSFDVIIEDHDLHKDNNECHHHAHRCINDIYKIIDSSNLSNNAKKISKKIFDVVTDAEAVVHKKPRDEVHFHEVGAVDSIVDICAVAFCLDNLNIDRVICSQISEGNGHIKCCHGVVPIPVPATAEIARQNNIPLNITDTQAEMITPTGVAIACAITSEFKKPSSLNIKKIGIGAGKKNFNHANILRAFLLEENTNDYNDEIVLIQTSIDDNTPEELGFILEKLFDVGVKDAFYTPIFMKKNRPAFELTVMSPLDLEKDVINIIFKNSSAIGVRREIKQRVKMKRIETTVKTKQGEVKANRFVYDDIEKISLEYESVKKLANEQGCSILDIYRNY